MKLLFHYQKYFGPCSYYFCLERNSYPLWFHWNSHIVVFNETCSRFTCVFLRLLANLLRWFHQDSNRLHPNIFKNFITDRQIWAAEIKCSFANKYKFLLFVSNNFTKISKRKFFSLVIFNTRNQHLFSAMPMSVYRPTFSCSINWDVDEPI